MKRHQGHVAGRMSCVGRTTRIINPYISQSVSLYTVQMQASGDDSADCRVSLMLSLHALYMYVKMSLRPARNAGTSTIAAQRVLQTRLLVLVTSLLYRQPTQPRPSRPRGAIRLCHNSLIALYTPFVVCRPLCSLQYNLLGNLAQAQCHSVYIASKLDHQRAFSQRPAADHSTLHMTLNFEL